VAGMKQILLMIAVVGCGKKPLTKEESAKIIERNIRRTLQKPTGELTQADLEKVTELNFGNNHLTSVKGLEKLTQLRYLNLSDTQLTDVKGLEKFTQLTELDLNIGSNGPDLTKAQLEELAKALPKCQIGSNIHGWFNYRHQGRSGGHSEEEEEE
jgi:hypothetical protein